MTFKVGDKRPPASGMPKGKRIRRLKDWPSAWWISVQAPRDLAKLYEYIHKRQMRHAKSWHKRQVRALLQAAIAKYGSHLAGGPRLTAGYDAQGILTLYRIEPDGTLTPILDHGIELAGY